MARTINSTKYCYPWFATVILTINLVPLKQITLYLFPNLIITYNLYISLYDMLLSLTMLCSHKNVLNNKIFATYKEKDLLSVMGNKSH